MIYGFLGENKKIDEPWVLYNGESVETRTIHLTQSTSQTDFVRHERRKLQN